MSVRLRVLLIVGAAAVALIGMLYASSRYLTLNRFVNLENQEARKTTVAVEGDFRDQIDKLARSNTDLSVYDATFDSMPKPTQKFLYSMLGEGRNGWMDQQKINFLLFVDPAGNTVFASGFDLSKAAATELPADLKAHIVPSDRLLNLQSTTDKADGLMLLADGPAFVSSRPIVRTNYSGPSRGEFIIGRYLDAASLHQLAEKNGASEIRAFRVDRTLPPDVDEARWSLTAETPHAVRDVDERLVAGYIAVDDIYGQPALVLRVEMTRAIYRQGRISQAYVSVATLCIVLTAALAMGWLLQRFVISRLEELNSSVASIAASTNISARVSFRGRDEISTLAKSITRCLSHCRSRKNAKEKGKRNIAPNWRRPRTRPKPEAWRKANSWQI